jgi:hypothetical protein
LLIGTGLPDQRCRRDKLIDNSSAQLSCVRKTLNRQTAFDPRAPTTIQIEPLRTEQMSKLCHTEPSTPETTWREIPLPVSGRTTTIASLTSGCWRSGGSECGRAGRYADQQPFLFCQLQAGSKGLLVLHLEDLIYNASIQDIRNKPADSLYL